MTQFVFDHTRHFHLRLKHLLLGLLSVLTAIFIFCLASMGTVLASGAAPAALPESGLPPLPDYEAPVGESLRSFGSLPASYNSRNLGLITPVKNQEPFGTCWAFAALAAGEASMVKKGIADNSIDLSELHFAYFFYNTATDPLKNTKGDKVINQTGNNYMDAGGNNLFTMFALAKWTGPAPEKTVPYRSTLVPSLSKNLAYQNVGHMQNARFVNTRDRANVKKLIMQYGAVSTAMYYQNNYLNTENASYNSPETAYRFYINNHIVCLVGWDDNYPKENFLHQPSGNGAWIAKNSYGTAEGDNGYIYISYEDAVLGGKNARDSLSYAFDLESADNYDHNYQYDGSSSIETLKISSGGSLSNVYTIKGNPGGNERLDAVSFSLFSQNVSYSIQIYKNPKDGSPTSGSPVLATPQTGRTTYSGYYTVELDRKPVFQQGDTIAIVITFRSGKGSRIESFIDLDSDINDVKFVSKSSNNLSFVRASLGSAWEDLNLFCESATARIKAFTTDTTARATKVDVISSSIRKPKISALSSYSCNRAILSWNRIPDVQGYEVYRSPSKNGTYQLIGKVKSCSYTDRKRAPGFTYYYKIRAYKKEKAQTVYSRFSSVRSLVIRPEKAMITSLKTYPKLRKVKIFWKKQEGIHGYALYRSSRKNGNYELLDLINGKNTCTYTDRVPKMRNYYYKVRAYRIVDGKRLTGTASSPWKAVLK